MSFHRQFELHLYCFFFFLQTATVIGRNKWRDLSQFLSVNTKEVKQNCASKGPFDCSLTHVVNDTDHVIILEMYPDFSWSCAHIERNSYIKFRCISKLFWKHFVFLCHLVHWIAYFEGLSSNPRISFHICQKMIAYAFQWTKWLKKLSVFKMIYLCSGV